MKKFLALVMALAMVMSLTVVSTSAKDFTDDDSITYTEAIDVISALEIMDGYTDGSFQPNTQLNRGQAAKIICNLILGVAAADNLTATKAPFPDVPASHIFAGYISYCAQEGIISGYSDGYFRPGDTLSGYAFMKMLLGALGYDQTNEGLTGSNWTIQCAKLVQGIGLARDLEDDFLGSKTVTREEAALYALNTLQARTVEYVVPGGSFTVNGVEINQKASNASYRTYGTIRDGSTTAANDGNISGDGYVQFAEEHFPRLVLNRGENDSFGRPQHTWTYKGDKVGSYTDTPDATYEAYVTMADVYDDLALTSTTDDFVLYIDGMYAKNFYPFGYDPEEEVTDYEDEGPAYVQADIDWVLNDDEDNYNDQYRGLSAWKDTTGKVIEENVVLTIDDNTIADNMRIGAGPGSVIECYKTGTQNGYGTIVVINTYVGEVTSVNDAEGKRSANIEISPVGEGDEARVATANDAMGIGFLDGDTYADTFNTEKFDVGDIVTFNYAFNTSGSKASIKNVAVAETVEGEVKDYTDQEKFTLDSTEYDYSKMSSKRVKAEDVSTNIVAYLDKQGNVLYFDEGKDNNKNFALVLDAGVRSAVGRNSFEAELLFADGTTKLVTTDKEYGGTNDEPYADDDTCFIGKWVTFREKTNGQYVLTRVNENTDRTFDNMTNGYVPAVLGAPSEGIGSDDFVIGNTSSTAASNVTLTAGEVVRVNSSTVIIVQTKPGTFKVYNGVKELPLITAVTDEVTGDSLGGEILYSAMTRNKQVYAKFLYVDATHADGDVKLIDVRNRTNNDIFLVGNGSQGSSVDNNGNTFYRFKGVVDGEVHNTANIKLNWNDPKTQDVINELLGVRANSGIALSNYSVDEGIYEVALDDAFDDDGEKGVIATESVDKVTADVIEIDGGDTYDLAEGCQFFRVDGSKTNTRVVESTWKGISKGGIVDQGGSDRYEYVALSLNRDYEVTAVYWRMAVSK